MGLPRAGVGPCRFSDIAPAGHAPWYNGRMTDQTQITLTAPESVNMALVVGPSRRASSTLSRTRSPRASPCAATPSSSRAIPPRCSRSPPCSPTSSRSPRRGRSPRRTTCAAPSISLTSAEFARRPPCAKTSCSRIAGVPSVRRPPARSATCDAIRAQHRHVRHRPGRHRQDLPRHGHGRGRAQAQGGRPHHPHASRGGGGGEPGLSARHAHREGGPLHPAALRRAVRHDRHGARAAAHREAASSRSRRSPSCAGAP